VGALVGATYLVARTAIGDGPTLGIGGLSLLVLARWTKLPDAALVLGGAVLGLVVYPVVRPDCSFVNGSSRSRGTVALRGRDVPFE
jgi:hypothetical protein